MDNHQLINQDSGNCEWYTPLNIILSAKRTMKGIDLDPFSSEKANENVLAGNYFSEGGFEKDWYGKVWCNHPFSRENNKKIANKVIEEYISGRVSELCMITFAATSEKWFQPLLKYPQCFLHSRTNYLLPDGTIKKGVTKGSVVTYLGDNLNDFITNFRELGTIKVEVV